MITFWSPRRGGWGRRGAPWSFPCPESPRRGRAGSRTSGRPRAIGGESFSGSEDGLLRSSSPVMAPQQEMRALERERRLRETRGSAARARPPVAARVRGSLGARAGGEAWGRRLLSCGSRLRAPRVPSDPGRGRAGKQGARGGRGAARSGLPLRVCLLPAPGEAATSFAFQQSIPAITSAPISASRAGPGAGLALKVVPGPGCAGRATDPRYSGSRATALGVRPGCPGLGRARALDDGGSQALSAPFPFTLFPTPHPQPELARPARWAGGGEVGGELCGAHRQWGSLAEPRDAPGKVAKCRLCCSPGRRPKERPWQVQEVIAERKHEGCLWDQSLARSFPRLSPFAASGSLPPAPPGRSHAPSAALWGHFG